MRTILLRFCYLLLAALMICATASVAVPFPTNMDLLVETVASAVDESLARIDMPDDAAMAPLLVAAQSKHDANWMVEHLLANRLLTRGFSVTRNNRSRLPRKNIRIIARIIRDHHTLITGIFNTRFENILRQTLRRFANRPQIDPIGTRTHLAPNTPRTKLDMRAKSILELVYIFIFNKQLNFRYKIGKFRFDKPL